VRTHAARSKFHEGAQHIAGGHVPLSSNQTMSIMGLSARTGLLCRAGLMCLFSVQVPGNMTATSAALIRDAHEVEVHGYHHIAINSGPWNYVKNSGGRRKK